MSRVADHHAEAVAAMRKAVAATCPVERRVWLEAAVAWKELARLVEATGAA